MVSQNRKGVHVGSGERGLLFCCISSAFRCIRLTVVSAPHKLTFNIARKVISSLRHGSSKNVSEDGYGSPSLSSGETSFSVQGRSLVKELTVSAITWRSVLEVPTSSRPVMIEHSSTVSP